MFCTRKLMKWIGKKVKMRKRLELRFQTVSCLHGREESMSVYAGSGMVPCFNMEDAVFRDFES